MPQHRARTDVLKLDPQFSACPVEGGDELYANGIFEFNVTRILKHIAEVADTIPLVEIAVSDFHRVFSSINESHVESVDLSLPAILAEIAPDRYNLIDGNHRVEKARRLGIPTLTAYKLTVRQHLPFLTSKEAYAAYVEYWNSKLTCR